MNLHHVLTMLMTSSYIFGFFFIHAYFLSLVGPALAFEPEEWGFWFKIASTPVIVFVGIIGNILSLVVMKSEALRHKSYSHYLCALAVFDTLTLIINLIATVDDYYMYFALPGVFHNFSSLGCKLYNFMSHVITLMSSWIIVLMAIERLMAVCLPFKKVLLRTQSGAAIAICVLLLAVSGSQSFRLVMIDHVTYDEAYRIQDCLAGEEYMSIYTSLEVYYYFWTLLFAMPVIVVLMSNSLVLYQIFKVRKEFKKERNNLINRNVRTTQRSTIMLIGVAFAYIITLLPTFLLSLVVDLTIKFKEKETAIKVFFTLTPYLKLTESIALLNYALNFFIYVVSGKRFRFELRKKCNYRIRVKRNFTRTRSTREECIRLQLA